MKNALRFFVFISLLLSADHIFAQSMPMLPPPEPMSMPNCPSQLMGQIDGIYYWQTRNCPVDANSGFAQTNNNLPVPCCTNTTGSWVCNCGLSVRPTARTDAKEPHPADNAVQSSANALPMDSSACDLPQSTETEINDKLAAIIAECEENKAYLTKLGNSPEVQNSDVRNQKGRINYWLITVSEMLVYLKDGSDEAQVKINKYCSNFLPKDRLHKFMWRHSILPLGSGKKQLISNDQQPDAPKTAADVVFNAESGVTVYRGPIVRVNVANLPTTDKRIWFQTFKVYRGSDSFYVGVQVLDPGSGDKPAIFVDRHNFGHKIRIPSTGETFLVTSHEDLGISK